MTDISPLTSGTPARRSSPLAPIAGGMVVGGIVVAIVGVVPLIILAVLIGLYAVAKHL